MIYDTGYGTVVEGASVTLHEGGAPVKVAFSDKNGRYTFEGVPTGHYTVAVECAGFSRRTSELTVNAGNAQLDVGIDVGRVDNSAAFNIGGGVAGPEQKPLSGVSVTVLAAFDKAVVLQSSTDAEGRYRIDIPRHGHYIVYAAKPGFKPVVQQVTSDGPETVMDFTLSPFHFSRG
jgi:hypothetical protein